MVETFFRSQLRTVRKWRRGGHKGDKGSEGRGGRHNKEAKHPRLSGRFYRTIFGRQVGPSALLLFPTCVTCATLSS